MEEGNITVNTCIICGKQFKPDRNHPKAQSCSKKCCKRYYYLRNKTRILRPKKQYSIRICEFCGKSYKPTRFDRKFCSRKCQYTFFKNSRKKHVLKEKSCENCSKLFIPHYLHPQARFCSERCHKAYKGRGHKEGWNTKKYCKKCGKLIIFDKKKPLNTQIIKKYCSSKCRAQVAEQNFKFNSPAKYKAKIQRRKQSEIYKERNRLNAKIRKLKLKNVEHAFKPKEWIAKKAATNGYCPKCHKYVGVNKLTLDHIYPVSKAIKDYEKTGIKRTYTIDDVRPLCMKCNVDKSDKF